MTTIFRRPMLVLGTTLLIMQAVFMPVGMVYAETMVDTEEQERMELPPMKNYLEEEQPSEPRFFFSRSRMQGMVEESLNMTFFSDQEVTKANVQLPKGATLLNEQLPTGLSAVSGEKPGEWIIQATRAQNTFVLPLLFDSVGTYEVTAEEATAHVEIRESEEVSEEALIEETATPDGELAEQEDVEEAAESEELEEEQAIEEGLDPELEAPQDQQTDEEEFEATVFDGETAEVTTFAQLQQAVANSNVGVIEVRNNLTRSGTAVGSAIGSLNRSLLIRGNGFTINFGANNGSLGLANLSADSEETIRLENVIINKEGTTPIFNAENGVGWTLELEDVSEASTTSQSGIASVAQGNIVFTGGTNHFPRGGQNQQFNAKNIIATGGAQVTIFSGSGIPTFVSGVTQGKVLVTDSSSISITTGSSTTTPIDLRGANSEIEVSNNSNLSIQTHGTTAAATNTTNNAIQMPGNDSSISITDDSVVTISTTNAKRGIVLLGSNPSIVVEDSSLAITSQTGAALTLSGEYPSYTTKNSTNRISSTTGQRMNLTGINPVLVMDNSHLEMTATTGRGIFLQGETPQVLMDNSQLVMTDTGASSGMTLSGTDALLSLSNQSEMTITGAGTGTTENIQIGNTNARPELSVTGGSKLSVTTTSGTTAATDTANNALHLRGADPKATVSGGSELAISITSNARRGMYLNGDNPELTVTDSQLEVKTVTGSRIDMVGTTPILSMNNSHLEMTATTGRGIFLQGVTPQVLLDNSQLLMTDTGASQGMILQGTDALLSLSNQSEFHLTGEGTGTTQNIQIGNNNSRPELSVTDGSKLSITTTSGTTEATDTTNNAIHLRGNNAIVNVQHHSELDIDIQSGARRALYVNGNTSIVNISSESNATINSISGNSIHMQGDNNTLTLLEGSLLNTVSGAVESIQIAGNNATLLANDQGTKLTARSNFISDVDSQSTIRIGGLDASVRSENYSIEVGKGAILSSKANISSAVQVSANDGEFVVYDQGKLLLESGAVNGTGSNANATLRFSRTGPTETTGGHSFLIDNGIMEITKPGGNASALRMFGSNNQIAVENKGKFIIDNAGSGSGSDGGSGTSSQGIDFRSGNNNRFVVKDPGSAVEINAQSGPAVDMNGGTGSITASNGGYFEASGRTATAASGIFNAGELTVDFDNPLFMDFRNNRSEGGNIFNNAAASVLEAKSSALSVWHNGSNLDGDPDLNFPSLDFSFTGTNFNTLGETSQPEVLNTDTFGTTGLTAYSRLSSNNGNWAIADELRVPTNADKKIHGRVSLPVGLDDSRPAWDDEAIVTVEVESLSGESTQEYTTKTVGHSNTSPGISIYGEEPRGGLFEITLDEPLEAGSKVQISNVELTSGELTEGFEHLILTDTVEVFPIVPPTPASFSSSYISSDSTMIQGYSENKDVEITVTHNGSFLDLEEVLIDNDGTFQLDLSDVSLAEDDELQLFLRDNEGSAYEAGVVNPPDTNNARGNINPASEVRFRDQTFVPATILTVLNPVSPVDPLNPENEVDPENKPELPEDQGPLSIDFVSQFTFGSQAISVRDQTYYAQPQRLLNPDGTVNETAERPNYVQISDRRSEAQRNGWSLALTQREQFKGENDQELLGASLRLENQQLVSAQGNQAPSLQVTNPLQLVPGNKRTLIRAEGDEGIGTWIYRFGDGHTAGESVALHVPQGSNPEATGYSTTLVWELSAVPGN